ncbi:ErfK/YbiS/YcfS/YnhG family protein [Chthoniobacter flavus Ellin428]|uniref:ErfK/YbiS/YcfS/YnhG family protein n=1 Tax=Chthoniobacter flavus Ellin428 TaxID=497964 RepID=B4D4A6_9BACT|nr:L,D-transpeptidase [Chthoniobacter flavus]EDY18707.1 ErfK/YbiS/YcfS/YnhG family protein [Chthoniobacter flavus Ellin428]TCO89054.1 L,D-transpeptidase-like protein [Chthoniobacter flavus]
MKRLLTLTALAAVALLTGCANGPIARTTYNVVAYKPHNPNDVRIKVSLSNRAVYVMEGNTPLLVTACAIGKPDHPTPTGNFRISGKIPNKRSGEYGFSVNGDNIQPAKAEEAHGHYVGFPMAWWSEFAPGYGFHEGAVWPTPRTHGCIRLHHNVAPKFYVLAKPGTPVNIAQSQPEDQTIGKNMKRPLDYADPDPLPGLLISDRIFSKPTEPLLVDRP